MKHCIKLVQKYEYYIKRYIQYIHYIYIEHFGKIDFK